MLSKEERLIIKKYCLDNNLNYNSIYRRIKYYLATQENKEKITLEKLIKIAEYKYNQKQLKNEIIHSFNKLEYATTNKEYREICNNLQINWNHILKLSYKGYNLKELILYFWYFSDVLKDGKKDLSRKRLNEIYNGSVRLKKDIYYLISFYKCGKTDCLEEILVYEEKHLKKLATSVGYRFKLTKLEVDDLISEARVIFIETLKKVVLNNIEQIISYIRIVIFGRLVQYAKKNYRKISELNEKYMYKSEELDECSIV